MTETKTADSAGHFCFLTWLYRFRWPAAIAVLGLTFGLTVSGWGKIEAFSASIDTFADPPLQNPEPQMFDPRVDIWFDAENDGLHAFREIERRFVAQDVVLAAFEVPADPLGVFGLEALERVARVTERLKRIPYVSNVRSLTENPWIRWGKASAEEQGLIVSDLFERAPGEYTDEERLQRMIAVLGAERTAKLAGEERVRQSLGPNARFDDHIGEPRLLRSVVSEDGRTTALLIQIQRPKLTEAQLNAAFGEGPSPGKLAAPAIHVSTTQKRTLDEVDRVLAEEREITWHLAGMPVLERHFPAVSKADMGYFGLMLGGIALVLLVLYRRISAMVVPMVVVAAAVMGMNGAVWTMGDLMNNLTAIGPNILIAVGVADSVHLLSAYFALRPFHHDKRALVDEVLRKNWMPVLLTSLTTAIGFFSLTTSEVRPMRALGYTVGIGTCLAYLISMTLVPALLSLYPLKRDQPVQSRPTVEDELKHWSATLVAFTSRNAKAIAGVTAGLLALSAIGMARMTISTDMRTMFPSTDPVRRDLEWIGARLGGAGDLELLFKGPPATGTPEQAEARQRAISALRLKKARATSAGGLTALAAFTPHDDQELNALLVEEDRHQRSRIATSAPFLQQVDALQRRIEEKSRVPGSPLAKLTSFDGGLTVLRKMHQVQNENKAEFYRVPTEADVPEAARKPVVVVDDVLAEGGELVIPAQSASSMASQYYLQYESGARPSESLASMVSQERDAFRISARLDQGPTDILLRGFQEIRDLVQKEFPALQGTPESVAKGEALSTMSLTGRFYLFMNMFDEFVTTLVESLLLALASITVCFVIAFRSWRVSLVSMIPNILPVVLPLGALGLLGIPLDGPAVLVAAIALGICVDDTIHLLSRYTASRRAGVDVEPALREAYRETGVALTYTTIILVFGFGLLMLSNLRPNIVIGYMCATMIALAWVGDFFVLPALLRLIDRRPA